MLYFYLVSFMNIYTKFVFILNSANDFFDKSNLASIKRDVTKERKKDLY